MKLVKKINIELNRKGFPKEIDVVQYDTGLQLKCIVKDFDIPDGTIATLYAEKPSGKFVYQQTGIEISDNTIIVDLENQAITEHGKVWMQITLKNGTDTISTFEMLIKVQKSRKDSGAVESTTVIRAFDEAVEKAVEQINEARDAASKYISESVDPSLKISGKAADAAAVGEKVNELNENIANMSETKENIADIGNIELGKAWNLTENETRAILPINVQPNMEYSIDIKNNSFDYIRVIEKATYDSGNIANTTLEKNHTTIRSTETTKWFFVQFEKSNNIVESDFNEFELYVYTGSTKYLSVDVKARERILNIEKEKIQSFKTFKEMADSEKVGLNRVGGYLFRNIVAEPKTKIHKQDAISEEYYDVNSTLKNYECINKQHKSIIPNICNHLRQKEIDFTPDNGYTRIIVGKNSEDIFFVSHIASDRVGEYGKSVYNTLEITTDFITFTPILRSSQSDRTKGIKVPNMTNLDVKSVKEFADGSYIVAMICDDTETGNHHTRFFRMSYDFTSIEWCKYENVYGEIVHMSDEFANNLYDWSINVIGSKALVSTYGSRNPENDLGRVWYTEDNGKNWKQIFQTSAMLSENELAHTHGVMIDHYSNRLFVLVGENHKNIYWSDKGYETTIHDWNKIDLKNKGFYEFQDSMQVVNGYAFDDCLIFGSDNEHIGCIYRINKLDDGNYSTLESAYEFLPNKVDGTNYCSAEMYRRDLRTPLFFCETSENPGLSDSENDLIKSNHKARVIATYDGINFTEIWTDDTFGSHDIYINGETLQKNYPRCTRGMQFYLLKNGDAIIKYSGREHYYLGGSPMYSVMGKDNSSCKIRYIHNVENYI